MSLGTVLEKETVTVDAEAGDHDKFAHYCSKEDLENAVFHDIPATALCGKKWLPFGDFKSFPVCKTCEERYLSLPAGD